MVPPVSHCRQKHGVVLGVPGFELHVLADVYGVGIVGQAHLLQSNACVA